MSAKRNSSLRVDITYVVPVVSLELDTSGFFKIVLDTAVTGDNLTRSVSKLLADVQTTPDNIAILVSRPLASTMASPTDALQYDFAKKLQSTQTVQDSLTKGASKLLADSHQASDFTTVEAQKGLGSVVGPQDAAPTFSVLKGLSDGFAMNDTSSSFDGSEYSLHKFVNNVAFLSDLIAQTTSKLLPPDSFQVTDFATTQAQKGLASTIDTPSDFVNFITHKVLSDSVTMLDEFDRLILAIRERDENQPVIDQVSITTTLNPFVDSVQASDFSTLLLTKNLATGFAMNDSADAGDGSTYSFSKGVSNVAFVGDVVTRELSKPIADSLGLADSGLVSAQNYADPSYFAEDYVGVSTTF